MQAHETFSARGALNSGKLEATDQPARCSGAGWFSVMAVRTNTGAMREEVVVLGYNIPRASQRCATRGIFS